MSCIASSDPVGKWSGPKDPTVSSENITNLTANTTFTLTCTNQAGQVAMLQFQSLLCLSQ